MSRVIVTRPEPDATRFADLCRAHDLDPVLSPVMEIHIAKTIADLSDVGALAFTSANGVRAFAANCDARDLPVYAVGDVTAQEARAAGFARIHVAGGDVESLAGHIASESRLARKALLHVAGEHRAGDLVALLESQGIAARRQSFYRAAPAQALSPAALSALDEPGADGDLWVSLFSPRTAKLFVALAERANALAALGRVHAACLSEAVAEAAGPGWAAHHIAPEMSAESLISLISAQKRA